MAYLARLGSFVYFVPCSAFGCAVGVEDDFVTPVVTVEDSSPVPAADANADNSSNSNKARQAERAGDAIYFGRNDLEGNASAETPPSYTFELVADSDVTISLSRKTKDGPSTIGFIVLRVTGSSQYAELGKTYGYEGSAELKLHTVYGGTYAIRLLDGLDPDSFVLKLSCNSQTCAPRSQPGEDCSDDDETRCDKGLVCLYEDSTCDVPERVGRCLLAPDECPSSYNPVCGCDGETWGNPCFAKKAGASVQYKGECK